MCIMPALCLMPVYRGSYYVDIIANNKLNELKIAIVVVNILLLILLLLLLLLSLGNPLIIL